VLIDFRKHYQPTERQIAFHTSDAKFRMYGGAMGGGKTYALCAEAIQLSLDFAGNRGVLVRKSLVSLKRTTWITFFKLIPPHFIKNINKTDLIVTLINDSEVLFMDADISKDPTLNKFRGLEVGWFGLEEANELDVKVFSTLVTRLRWVCSNGIQPYWTGFLSSNPELCWVKDRFVSKKLPDHDFIPALPSDNPFLDDSYIASMKDILTEEEASKYLEGSWEAKERPDQLIPYRYLKDLLSNEITPFATEVFMGVDVARFGDDTSTIALYDGFHLFALNEYRGLDTQQLARQVALTAGQYRVKNQNIVIDAVGIGGGVVDALRTQFRINAVEFIGGKPAKQIDSAVQFVNLRSQGYWMLRQAILNEELEIVNNKVLVEELVAHTFKISSDRTIMVESKDKVKSILGRSPDKSDAVMMCIAQSKLNLRNEIEAMIL